jgi:transcription factor TFIIIB component B''
MCIDRRTGKKSSRYPELQEAERQRRRLRTLQRDQTQDPADPAPQEEAEEPTNGSLELTIPAVEEDDDALVPANFSTAMLMTDSNDNIIIDRSTLQIDRQPVHPSQLTDSLIHTTETIFSSKVNSGTYPSSRTHASSNIRWLPADNEAFYQALQMFGTDFDLVAEWVGGKTRRHVKNKFYREEKRNEDKLTWALKNRLPADVGELERRRGRKLRKLDEMEEWQVFRQEAEAIKALPRISESQGATEKGKGKARETLLGDF